MNSRRSALCPRPSASLRRRAFVLLEVILAMAILGGAIAVIMRGFTQALRSIEYNRMTTTGMLLAQRLLDEYETQPPEIGVAEGIFPDFPLYSWRCETTAEPMRYHDSRSGAARNELSDLIMVRLWIYYQPEGQNPTVAFDVTSALTQFERFTFESRLRSGLFLHENSR